MAEGHRGYTPRKDIAVEHTARGLWRAGSTTVGRRHDFGKAAGGRRDITKSLGGGKTRRKVIEYLADF